MPERLSGRRTFTFFLAVILIAALAGFARPARAEQKDGLPQNAAIVETAVNEDGSPVKLNQFEGKKVGIQTGTHFDTLVSQRIPDARLEYFNTKADLAQALTDGKIDAIAMDAPVIRLLQSTYPQIIPVAEPLDNFQFSFAFPRSENGAKLVDEFNDFLEEIRGNGQMAGLIDKWFGDNPSGRNLEDYTALPASKGTLKMATESGYEPFVYVEDGRVVGYEIELAVLFCRHMGCGLEVVDMNFDAIIPSVSTGKCDFAGAGLSMTPERMESVFFSAPTYEDSARLAVYKAAAPGGPASFGEWLVTGFEKTFLRENRWELFLRGVLNTMIITLSSILIGTVLGFLVYMLGRKGNPVARHITAFMTALIQGMPLVVLLMIFYYLIFSGINIDGIIVSIVAFSLTFGSGVYGLLRMGVGAVDPGQKEAALALGYSDRRTFFKIILPQALPHIMPSYRAEIVSLIKATAVVGYIAVQDLTKMSDIIRSRTYDAFFPLISITVIYFALEGLLAFLVGKIPVNPKRRSAEHILKGVVTNDRH